MSADRLDAAKEELSRVLKQIFQFDCADLDFGIYRILALRRAELERFVDVAMLPQVEGMLGEQPDVAATAGEVFDHLTTFFGRYYEDGELLARPRHKGDTYDDSDVKLHWANSDQYYVKTSEQHADYRAELPPAPGLPHPALVLKLAAAEAVRDNTRAGEKRRYVLRAHDAVELNAKAGALTVWFEYRAPNKSGRQPTQRSLCSEAEAAVLAELPAAWRTALARPAAQDGACTQLGYQLYRYTRKISSDCFIHKDLGGFLRRELDSFIKDEVLSLDDLERLAATEVQGALRKIRALRGVAGTIIDWLGQLEELRERLYLKKKFVLRTDWVGSTAHLPEPIRDRLFQDASTLERWRDLGFGALLGTEPAPALPVELSRVPRSLRAAARDCLRNANDRRGLLVRGDNFGALRLLQPTHEGQVSAIFIDPPYNTGGDRFLYRDAYRHSCWLSMFKDRLVLARTFLQDSGVCFFTLDEVEAARAWLLAMDVFGEDNFASEIIWEKKRKPSFLHRNIGKVTDFVFAFTRDAQRSPPFSVERTTDRKMTPLNNAGNNESTLTFPDRSVRFDMHDQVVPPRDMSGGNIKTVLLDPVTIRDGTNAGSFRLRGEFRYNQAKLDSVIAAGADLYVSKLPFRVNHIKPGGQIKKMRNVLSPHHYEMETNEDASQQLTDLFGRIEFPSAKPEKLVRYLLRAVTHSTERPQVLDFFAGSGTTAHAVLNANRTGEMHADYVVVEVGEHFDSVLLPRVLKASAGTSWRRGQLAESAPYVATHKVVHLESYDDTLENVVLHRDASVGPPSSSNASLREDHNLRYVLDLESRGSLLALDGFARPWDYTIKIREHGVVQDSPVDLVETFNYLLGLRVQRYDSFGEEGLLFVTGEDPDGQRVVVIWRDCDAWPNDALELRCRQIFDARPADRFDVVYVNGDNHLPTIRAGGERCEVSPTEQAFHGLMFDTCDVE